MRGESHREPERDAAVEFESDSAGVEQVREVSVERGAYEGILDEVGAEGVASDQVPRKLVKSRTAVAATGENFGFDFEHFVAVDFGEGFEVIGGFGVRWQVDLSGGEGSRKRFELSGDVEDICDVVFFKDIDARDHVGAVENAIGRDQTRHVKGVTGQWHDTKTLR